MTFNDMIMYTTKNNRKSVIAVGIIQNGVTNITLYGENGNILPKKEYIFEIGSITKTFTASLLLKAINDGKIDLNANIDYYFDLPQKDYYPTIKRLITHTAGYKSYYLDTHMIKNYFLKRGNIFYDINKAQLIERIGKIELKDKDYNFEYSNFGIAIIGNILSVVYGKDFPTLLNDFIVEELYLKNTKVSNGSGNLEKYWEWKDNDAFIAAGALISTIDNMLTYSLLQIDETNNSIIGTHKILVEVNGATANNEKLNINIDAIGMAWIFDKKNNIIWHNGGTGYFNSYLGFDPNKKVAVVILANLPPNYRIPATVIGVKLLTDLQSKIEN
jgi:CubicO group peptidase (beta-lactamase class C family)